MEFLEWCEQTQEEFLEVNGKRYINPFGFLDSWYNGVFIVGGRNTGKTFNALDTCRQWSHTNNEHRFGYLRRTIKEVQGICKSVGNDKLSLNPFKKVNKVKNYDVVPEQLTPEIYVFKEQDKHLGYIFPLSVGTEVKSADFSDVDVLIFDEFIPLPEQIIRGDDGSSFVTLYNTIDREREFIESEQGRIVDHKKKLAFVCLANSTTVNNAVFRTFDLVDQVAMASMKLTDKPLVLDFHDRHFKVILLPLTKEEKEEALQGGIYSMLPSDSKHIKSDLELSFYDDFSGIGKIQVNGYKPLYYATYKSKLYEFLINTKGKWYVRQTYRRDERLPLFNCDHGLVHYTFGNYTESTFWLAMIEDQVRYETMECKIVAYKLVNQKM